MRQYAREAPCLFPPPHEDLVFIESPTCWRRYLLAPSISLLQEVDRRRCDNKFPADSHITSMFWKMFWKKVLKRVPTRFWKVLDGWRPVLCTIRGVLPFFILWASSCGQRSVCAEGSNHATRLPGATAVSASLYHKVMRSERKLRNFSL